MRTDRQERSLLQTENRTDSVYGRSFDSRLAEGMEMMSGEGCCEADNSRENGRLITPPVDVWARSGLSDDAFSSAYGEYFRNRDAVRADDDAQR